MAELEHSSSLSLKKRYDVIRDISKECFHSLQFDFRNFFGGALCRAAYKCPDINIQSDTFPGTALGCTIILPGLHVHVLRRAVDISYRVLGDVVALEDSETKANIVLYGETMKRRLDRGVIGFYLPALTNFQREVKKLVGKWNDYSDNLKGQCWFSPNHFNNQAYIDILAETMTSLDLDYFEKQFVIPNFNKELILNYSQAQFCNTETLGAKHNVAL